MDTTPLVSIVIPVFNDEDAISGALDSCLAQTLTAIEVIVVDDCSTDDTVRVVEAYVAQDPRVRLLRQSENASAFQARRLGILAARSEYILFLDGDDELVAAAAELALAKASATHADLVQFGVEVVHSDGHTGGRFESRLQPRHQSLTGSETLRGLFPIDSLAQGQLWKYLFRRELLTDAYALLPTNLVLPRVNDLPIAFLAAALASRYDSIPDRLYRYHFGRGGSGQTVQDLATAAFYAGAIHSIDSIEPAVQKIAGSSADSELVLATYASVRRAIIGYTSSYLAVHTRADLIEDVLRDLYTRASPRDIVRSAALHAVDTLNTLATHAELVSLPARPVQSVLLATNHLRMGGISSVVVTQAQVLRDAGYRVTIAVREGGSDLSLVPPGVEFAEAVASPIGMAVANWGRLCAEQAIDIVVEHQWQYLKSWHVFALAARAEGAATIGWSHNFAGRSLLLGLGALETAPRYFPLMSHLVVLSPLDVAFWKLRGMPRVSYLPNPPSSMLREGGVVPLPRHAPEGRIELVWFGRLQERTKRVTELISVAEYLQRAGIDFRLRIIGPDWRDMNAGQLNELARERGLETCVQALGPMRGSELLAAIDTCDVFVNTSVIEGYPLTIAEAQARGLPVAMYELPWLALVRENSGIATAQWGDAETLAKTIVSVARDRERYFRMSSASLSAAQRELSLDFNVLYSQLLSGTLPPELSPEPTLEDAQQLVGLMIKFSELRASDRRVPRDVGDRSDRFERGTHEPALASNPIFSRFRDAGRTALALAPWLRPIAARVQRILGSDYAAD